MLALDLATTTGWAFGKREAVEYGSFRLGPQGCTMGEAFVALDGWLETQLATFSPAVLIFEAPMMIGRGAVGVVQRLMGLAAIAELIGLKHGLRVFQAETSTVTKHFTGRGRYPGGRDEKKQQVIGCCRLRGWSPQDDNAADALALLDYGQSLLNREIAVSRTAGGMFAR